jgi:uncharacterized membrane protein
MLNIVTVGDLGEVAKTPAWEAVFRLAYYRLAYYLLLFFAVISVAVLAAYLNETIVGPVNGGVMTHLLSAAWLVAWVSLIISSLSEVLLNVIAAKPAKRSRKTP